MSTDRTMQTALDTMNPNDDLKSGVYRHYKGGKYLVYEVGTHTETNERLVVYRPLYGTFGLSVRPLDMFLDQVPADRFDDNVSRPRFEYLSAAGEQPSSNGAER